ncbi:MAG: cupin domain-containing protein [Verrucomicrobiales bacterium]
MPEPRNLLHPLPPAGESEHLEDLLARPGCRVERIVSHGQASTEGFWYDQAEDEWVVITEGGAALEFEDPAGTVWLARGDSLLIPAGCRHRVASTKSPTVWLAIWLPK